ncbi:hypothetical protein M885DRAFT_512667 [Pelagophyceae sp. CCMP2097]|nr:hypothetical protein M885DRAFT_512667 [Pelagophyceae sp. CCMP2097]
MADDDDDSQGGAGSDDSSQGDAADGAVASPASPAAPRPAAGAAASPASPAAPRPGAGSAFDSEEDDDLAADTEDEEDNPALTDSDGDGDAPPPAADAPLQTADDDDGAAQLVDAAAGWDAAADAREAGLPQRRITVVKRRTAPAPSRHEAEDYGDSTTAWSAYSRAITSMADGDAESARRTLAALAEKGHLQGDPSVLLRLAQVQLLQALDLWPEKQIAAAKKAEALLEKARRRQGAPSFQRVARRRRPPLRRSKCSATTTRFCGSSGSSWPSSPWTAATMLKQWTCASWATLTTKPSPASSSPRCTSATPTKRRPPRRRGGPWPRSGEKPKGPAPATRPQTWNGPLSPRRPSKP